MWKCLIFSDSFKRGRRVAGREQTVNIIKKLIETARFLGENIPKTKTKIINTPELEVLTDEQNLFTTIFVPSLATEEKDYNKHITGMVFVEFDPLLEQLANRIFIESKSIYRSVTVKEEEVLNIMNGLKKKVEKKSFEAGDIVEITSGDYKDMVGRVEFIKEGLCKISIQIFGMEQIITVPISEIKVNSNISNN